MRRSIVAPLSLLAVALLGLAAVSAPFGADARLQQEESGSEILIRVALPPGGLPLAPAFVRILRINLEPGASSPLHTHPGPELGLVEENSLWVTVKGDGSAAILNRAERGGTPAATSDMPIDKEVRLRRGDSIAYLPEAGMTFRNASDERTTQILAAVIQPAGHQHPPGITYVEGQPGPEAFEGVTFEIFGDGIATVLPTGASVLTIERLTLQSGDPIPAFDGPVMISVEDGVLDFSVVEGRVQISRTADPGPQPEATPGTSFSLAKGDAAFFPTGMAETARAAGDGPLVLLRFTIAAAEEGGTPVASTDPPGVIAVATPSEPPATPEPEETEEPAATEEPEPTEEPEQEPTPTPESGKFVEGDLVVVTEDGLNVRTAPTTSGEIVTSLPAGSVLQITGPSEQGDDITWWPVVDPADESIAGYVAEQFIEKQEG